MYFRKLWHPLGIQSQCVILNLPLYIPYPSGYKYLTRPFLTFPLLHLRLPCSPFLPQSDPDPTTHAKTYSPRLWLFVDEAGCVRIYQFITQVSHLDHIKVGYVVSTGPDLRRLTKVHLRPAIMKHTQIPQPIEVRLVGDSNLTDFHRLSFFSHAHLAIYLLKSPTNQSSQIDR